MSFSLFFLFVFLLGLSLRSVLMNNSASYKTKPPAQQQWKPP